MVNFNSVQELESFYKQFEGQSLRGIRNYVQNKYPTISLSTNKGIVGQVLEALIGNAPNSDPNPDVKNINVELKVLPLRRVGIKVQPKERSKIKSINYKTIVDQEWHSSDVKAKMNKMLFLLYEQPIGKTYKDWQDFIFKGTMLYELESEKSDIVQEDWEGIRYKTQNEIADEISEADSRILGACTSGTGKLITYGSGKQAKQRSYSLKHSYLKVFYSEKIQKQNYINLGVPNHVEPQDYILDVLNTKLRGKNLKDFADEYGVEFSSLAKSSFRYLINRALDVDEKSEIRELAENNIIIKTVPINHKGQPWESMSFPKFSLVDLLEEEWGDNSTFQEIISQGFIFIPIFKEKYRLGDSSKLKFKDWTTWEIGKSVYWKANESELKVIKKEWELAKSIIEKGVETFYGDNSKIQRNNLIKMRDTKIIHIRPHARDSKDLDIPYFEYTSGKVSICWQSFWLNKNFVEILIEGGL